MVQTLLLLLMISTTWAAHWSSTNGSFTYVASKDLKVLTRVLGHSLALLQWAAALQGRGGGGRRSSGDGDSHLAGGGGGGSVAAVLRAGGVSEGILGGVGVGEHHHHLAVLAALCTT